VVAIEVNLLTGRYVAARFDDRSAFEWPPHPARLFSALVATAKEHGDLPEGIATALEWLERQGAPRVLASEAEARAGANRYVAENTPRVLTDWSRAEGELEEALSNLAEEEQTDDVRKLRRARSAVDRARKKLDQRIAKAIQDDGKANASACAMARETLPEHRGKQPRPLPSVTPHEPRVRYAWPDAHPDEATRRALDALARSLVRLGHSSTLVACRVVEPEHEAEAPAGLHTWVPTDTGEERLRTVAPRQLELLERAYTRHRGIDPRVLPAIDQPYTRADAELATVPPSSTFGEWLVLREVAPERGRRLGLRLTRTEDATRALRAALLERAGELPPGVLSGRAADGAPLDRPHAAFLVLADVGSRHASGAILGLAIVLPCGIASEDRRVVLRAVGELERDGLSIVLPRGSRLVLERIVDRDPRSTLDPSTWTRPSRRWATVTPIALDQNPGNLLAPDPAAAAQAAERAEGIVARACEYIGLPRPCWVQVMRRSLFDAAPEAQRFMPYPRNGPGSRRVCVHAELCFEQPVAGPVVLGAGRHFGVGLCRPRSHWS
jgi:CRISPR-associated protein Csb2